MHAAAAPFSFNPFDEATRRDPYALFALARREVDLVEALTYPLPVVVIAELIGVPAEDRAQFRACSNALVAPLGTAFFEIAPPERVATLRRVRGELEAYFVRLVEVRRREPRDDLLSALVAAELEGSRLSFEELLAMLILLLVAGNETTTHLIGNAVLAFLAHPEALAAVRADLSRDPASRRRARRRRGRPLLARVGEPGRGGLRARRRVRHRPRPEAARRLRLRAALLPGRVARDAGSRGGAASPARAHAALPAGGRCAAANPAEHRLPRRHEPARGAGARVRQRCDTEQGADLGRLPSWPSDDAA